MREEENVPLHIDTGEMDYKKECSKLRKALKYAVANIEQLKLEKGGSGEEEKYEVFQRDINRWKRKHLQMEKHHEEAKLLAQNLAEEIQQLRVQVYCQDYILYEREVRKMVRLRIFGNMRIMRMINWSNYLIIY